MLQAFGILVIINALVITGWWINSGHVNTAGAIVLCTVAVFVGLALLFSDRVTELTVKNIGTIKAAAKQAVVDANDISQLKKRIEDHSATVDHIAEDVKNAEGLIKEVARKNSEAEERLLALDKALEAGKKAVAELQSYSYFSSTVLAAQHDDRRAYERLWSWHQDGDSPFQKPAGNAIQTILNEHEPTIRREFTAIDWMSAADPNKLTLEELRVAYQQAPLDRRLAILGFTWKKRIDIPKKDRLEFLADVLRSDMSLRVLEYAGRYFEEGTHDKYKPLAYQAHLKWWAENRDLPE